MLVEIRKRGDCWRVEHTRSRTHHYADTWEEAVEIADWWANNECATTYVSPNLPREWCEEPPLPQEPYCYIHHPSHGAVGMHRWMRVDA